MVDINKLKEQAKAAAEKGLVKDQSKETSGDFKYEPPAAGPCVARLISYIEIGNHKPKVDKFNKGAQPKAIIQFELLGKKHAREIEVDGVKKIVYPVITEELSISGSKKSWFYRMVQALDYGRGFTNIAFMVGDAYKITVLHNEVEEGGKKAVFANIRDDSSWKISAPVQEVEGEDGELVTKKLKVPEPTAPLRLLLWDAPSVEMWDSIFIAGSRKREVDGKEVEVSNNWIQDRVTRAENFGGSAVEAVLASSNGGLPKQKAQGATESDEEADLLDDGDQDSGDDEGALSGPVSDPENDPLAGLDLED